MRAAFPGLLLRLLAAAVLLTSCGGGGGSGGSGPGGAGSVCDPYAQAVIGYESDLLTGNPWPERALGAPDVGSVFVFAPTGAWIVLDMGQTFHDGSGADLTIWGDTLGLTRSYVEVFTSSSPTGPWTLTAHIDSTYPVLMAEDQLWEDDRWFIDLADSGVTSARYVRFELECASCTGTDFPTFFLDALEATHACGDTPDQGPGDLPLAGPDVAFFFANGHPNPEAEYLSGDDDLGPFLYQAVLDRYEAEDRTVRAYFYADAFGDDEALPYAGGPEGSELRRGHGYETLKRDLSHAAVHWQTGPDPTQVILVAHSHGGAWAHAALRAVTELSSVILIDLDTNLCYWDLLHDCDTITTCTTNVQGVDVGITNVVWPNVSAALEVWSISNCPLTGTRYDETPNVRLDGSTTGLAGPLYNEIDDHSDVHTPGSDSAEYVRDWLLGQLDDAFGWTSGTNVALSVNGGQATAISEGTYTGTTEYASRAIDASEATTWSNSFTVPSASAPQWIQVEFDATYALERVGVTWASHRHEFSISLSTNGSSWTRVVGPRFSANQEGSAPKHESFPILPMSARYMRVDITSTSAPPTHIFQATLAEVEALSP